MTGARDITFEFARISKGSSVSLPATQRAILYHVRRGAILIKVASRPAIKLHEGDSASLPGGSPHLVTLVTDKGRTAPVPVTWHPTLSELVGRPDIRDSAALLFRSTISLSANAYPGLLPDLVVMNRSRRSSAPWFGTLIELFQQVVEMPPRLRIPAEERLAELMATSIDIVGLEEMENAIAVSPGQDHRMRRTLEKIHGMLEADWTLEKLSRAAGASRSAFVTRFKQMVGETPLGYITRLRMYKAARLLRTGDSSISDIAAHMGYASEASFTKAFHRVVGIPPGRFRDSAGHLRGRRSAIKSRSARTPSDR